MARTLSTLFGRRAFAASIAAASLGAATIPFLPGCQAVPVIMAGLTICQEILSKILPGAHEELPEGYRLCKQDEWRVFGQEVELCVYCSDDPAAVRYIRVNCEGPYMPIKMRRLPAEQPVLTTDRPEILKVDCEQRVQAWAYSAEHASAETLDAVLVLPDDRVLPDRSHHAGVMVTLDGRVLPPDGEFVASYGASLRVTGPIEAATHYAALLGLRTLDFTADGSRWHVEVNADLALVAILRDGAIDDVRYLVDPRPESPN
jgi:hypothetical protein